MFGFDFAHRGNSGVVRLHVKMAVTVVDVEVFELRRRWEDDVGVVRGVGLELIMNDGEQVFAHQPRKHARTDPAAHRGRVRVVGRIVPSPAGQVTRRELLPRGCTTSLMVRVPRGIRSGRVR